MGRDTGLDATPLPGEWALGLGGKGDDHGADLAVDAQGNVFFVGSFQGKFDFRGVEFESQAASDIFVLSLDSYGELRWVKTFPSPNSAFATAVGTDGQGNIFVAGHFYDELDLGCGSKKTPDASNPSHNRFDSFLAKLSPQGDCIWMHSFSSDDEVTPHDRIYDLAVDGQGNVSVVGELWGTVDFAGLPLTAYETYDAFVASFAGDGQPRWAHRHGGTSEDAATAVAVDEAGDVYSVGHDKQLLAPSTATWTPFLHKCRNDGVFQKVVPIGNGTTQSSAAAVAVAGDKVFVAGTFLDTIAFGGNTIPASGGSQDKDIFVAAYTAKDLGVLWAKGVGGSTVVAPTNDPQPMALAADTARVCLTGVFEGEFRVDSMAKPAPGLGRDIFVLCLAPAAGGEPRSLVYGTDSQDVSSALLFADKGHAYLAGDFGNVIDLVPPALPWRGGSDAFLARLCLRDCP